MTPESTAPEWTHHCYWLTEVRNCRYDNVHENIVIFSLCAHAIPMLVGTHALWLRYRHLWRGLYCRIRGHIVPSTVECLLVLWTVESYARVAFLLVTLLGAWPSPVWQEVAFSVAIFPFIFGIILFLCGLIAAIPPSLTYTHHVNADGTDSFHWSFSHWSKMPQRLSGAGVYVPSIRALQITTIIIMLSIVGAIIPLSVMNGLAWSQGNWDALLYWRKIEFLVWGAHVFIIFAITIYYSRGLSAIMRGSLQTPESEHDNTEHGFTSTDLSIEHGQRRTNRTMNQRQSYPIQESFVEPEARPRWPLAFVKNPLNRRQDSSNQAAVNAATRVEHIFTVLHIVTGLISIFAIIWAFINHKIISDSAANIALNIGMNGIVLPFTLGFTLWKLQQSTLATLHTHLSAVYENTKNALYRVKNAVRYPQHIISDIDGKDDYDIDESVNGFRKQPFEMAEIDEDRYNFFRQNEEYVWPTTAAEEQLNRTNRPPSVPSKTKLFKSASNEDITEFSSSWRLQAAFHPNVRHHPVSIINGPAVPRAIHNDTDLQPAWCDRSDISIKEPWIHVENSCANNMDFSSDAMPQNKHLDMEELDAFGPHHNFYTSPPRPQSPDPYDRGFASDAEPVNYYLRNSNNNNNINTVTAATNNNNNIDNISIDINDSSHHHYDDEDDNENHISSWWTSAHSAITYYNDMDNSSDDQESTLYSNPFPEV